MIFSCKWFSCKFFPPPIPNEPHVDHTASLMVKILKLTMVLLQFTQDTTLRSRGHWSSTSRPQNSCISWTRHIRLVCPNKQREPECRSSEHHDWQGTEIRDRQTPGKENGQHLIWALLYLKGRILCFEMLFAILTASLLLTIWPKPVWNIH